jgi:hypothetical protein
MIGVLLHVISMSHDKISDGSWSGRNFGSINRCTPARNFGMVDRAGPDLLFRDGRVQGRLDALTAAKTYHASKADQWQQNFYKLWKSGS